MVKKFKDLASQQRGGILALTHRLTLHPLQGTTHPLLARIYPAPNYFHDDIEFKLDRMSARLAFVETRDRLAKAQAARCPASVKKSKKHSNFLVVLGIMARKASHSTNRQKFKESLVREPGQSGRDAGTVMGYSVRQGSGRELRAFDGEQWIEAWIADVHGQVLPGYEESPPPYSP